MASRRKKEEARRGRAETIDRLSCLTRNPGHEGALAAYGVADVVHVALCAVLSATPSTMLAGTLPADDEDLVDRVECLMEQFREGP